MHTISHPERPANRRRRDSTHRATTLLASLLLAACGGSGASPDPAPVATETVAIDLAFVRLETGRPIALDLKRSSPRLAAAAATASGWQITLAPPATGLAADASVVSGTPTAPGRIVATVTASTPDGTTTTDTVTMVAVRTTTSGAPTLPTPSINYLSEPLPLHFTDPLWSDQPIALADNSTPSNQPNNAGIALGRVLFHDTRLSGDNTVSCASCHIQAFGFSDPSVRSEGVAGQHSERHAMSLGNVRYYKGGKMFWDERSPSLEAQAPGPITSPVEMNQDIDALVAELQATPFYPPLFAAAFGTQSIDANLISRALAQFQRALVSHRSRYDLALIGDGSIGAEPDYASHLTVEEIRGMALFQPVDASVLAAVGLPPIESIGCSNCHRSAIQIGRASATDAGVANIGLDTTLTDPGTTGIGDFKVPSLRNVEVTAPYMHDARFRTLEEVVRFFATGVHDTPHTSALLREDLDPARPVKQHSLSDADVNALVAFLKSLTDRDFLDDTRFSDPFSN